jgi:hypothetical protein
MQRRVFQSVGLLSVILICGCSNNDGGSTIDPNLPPPTPVSGIVTFGGEPLSGATVLFMPDGGTMESSGSGVTDAAGKYSLQSRTSSGKLLPGVAPGKYGVRFNKIVNADGTPFDPSKNPDQGPITMGGRDVIPTDYSLKAAFTVEVTKEKKDGYDFALEKKK